MIKPTTIILFTLCLVRIFGKENDFASKANRTKNTSSIKTTGTMYFRNRSGNGIGINSLK